MRIDKYKFKSLNALAKGASMRVDASNRDLVAWMYDYVSPNPEIDKTKHIEMLSWFVPYIRKNMGDNLFMVSKTIWDSVHANAERMMNMLIEEWLPCSNGAVLLPNGDMIMYNIQKVTEEQDEAMRMSDYETWSKEHCKGLAVIIYVNKRGEVANVSFSSNRLTHEGDGTRRVMHDMPNIKDYEFANSLLCMLAFLMYADTETVYVENGQKKISPNGEVLQNASGLKVRFYDSRWLREIIRTEGFGVRGHFRMQAVGKGRAERKLIYIHPFEKHGYHRRAGRDLLMSVNA